MARIVPREDKNGVITSFVFRVCLGREENGKQIMRVKYWHVPENAPKTVGKLMQFAQLSADQWEQEEKAKFSDSPENTKRVADKFPAFVRTVWWDGYVIHSKKPLSQLTIDFYKAQSEKLCTAPEFCKKKLTNIKPSDIDHFLNRCRDEGLSDSSVKHTYDTLRVILNYAERKDFIQSNPIRKADTPVVERKAVSRLSSDDIVAFEKALETVDIRHRLIVYIMLRMGLRRGEVCGLTWKDIDLENRIMHVEKNVVFSGSEKTIVKNPKSHTSRRVITIPETLIPLFIEWKAEEQKIFGNALLTDFAFLFPDEKSPNQPCNPQFITRWLSRFSERNNLTHVHPHLLRHTFGSTAAANGVETIALSRYLGHSNITTTSDYYVALEAEDLRCVSDVIDKVSGAK